MTKEKKAFILPERYERVSGLANRLGQELVENWDTFRIGTGFHFRESDWRLVVFVPLNCGVGGKFDPKRYGLSKEYRGEPIDYVMVKF